MRLLLLLLAILLFLPSLSPAADLVGAEFVRCYDGDTCVVNVPHVPPVFGQHLSVRLRGIDAPEIKGRCPSETAKAIAAREYLSARLKHARALEFRGVTRDKYFRVDATVWADGVNVNEEMVAMGFARAYDGSARQGWCQ